MTAFTVGRSHVSAKSRLRYRLRAAWRPLLVGAFIVIMVVDAFGAMYLDSKQAALVKRIKSLEVMTSTKPEVWSPAHLSQFQ